jgi:hypothetical protein
MPREVRSSTRPPPIHDENVFAQLAEEQLNDEEQVEAQGQGHSHTPERTLPQRDIPPHVSPTSGTNTRGRAPRREELSAAEKMFECVMITTQRLIADQNDNFFRFLEHRAPAAPAVPKIRITNGGPRTLRRKGQKY